MFLIVLNKDIAWEITFSGVDESDEDEYGSTALGGRLALAVGEDDFTGEDWVFVIVFLTADLSFVEAYAALTGCKIMKLGSSFKIIKLIFEGAKHSVFGAIATASESRLNAEINPNT